MSETRRCRALLAAVAATALLAGCAETEFAVDAAKSVGKQSATKTPQGKGSYYKLGSPYKINGVWYYPEEDYDYDRTGVASWYGPGFHGRLTANGEIYDENDVTAAHPTLPLPSLVKVTNLDNGRELVVRLNDRGPYADGRIIDLSRRSAQMLGIEKTGLARVRVQVLEEESRQLAALARQGITDMTQLAAAEVETVPAVEAVVQAEPAADYVTVPPKEQITPQPAATRVQVAKLDAAPAVATAPIGAVESQELPPLPGTSVAAPPAATVEAVVTQPMALAAPQPIAPAVVVEPLQLAAVPAPSAPPQPQYVWGKDNMAPVVDGPGPKAVAAPQVIEAVATTRADGSATIVAAGAATLYVQAGAFSQQQNADAARSMLSAIGPTLVTPVTVGDKQLYRVRLGPVASPEEANRLLQQVIGAGIADARIVAETNS